MARVQGRGSIQALEKPERTCKRWRLRVGTGYDYVTKKYTQATRIFRGTKTQAQAALRDFIEEVESGMKLKKAKMSFAEYTDEWLEARRLSGDIAKGTQRKNTEDLTRLMPYLGNIALADLDSENIGKALTLVRINGGKQCKAYSGTTMNGVYRALYMVLESARKAKIIAYNPCEDVPAPRKDTKEKEAMPQSEARRLIGILMDGDPESSRMAFLLALTCGLRREEACGLCWRDFDPVNRCIRVQNAYSADDLELVKPKTESSQRIIPLTPDVYERMREWKTVQAVQLLELGIPQSEDTPVVSTPDGGHKHPENLARSWRRFKNKHGFEPYTLHQLRHTFATRLVAAGVDMKTASTLMGHSSIAMLEKIYAHFVSENAEKAIAALNDDLFGESESVIVPFTDIQKTA